eukprot:scaffold130330_cov18-Tisochrysis_lutea.AAC.1
MKCMDSMCQVRLLSCPGKWTWSAQQGLQPSSALLPQVDGMQAVVSASDLPMGQAMIMMSASLRELCNWHKLHTAQAIAMALVKLME